MFKFNPPKFLQSFFSFVKNLFIALWPSLLLLLIGVYLPLQIFGLLAAEVWDEGGFPWDNAILLAIHKTATTQLDVFALTLTKFGSIKTVGPIVLIISLVLLLQKRWRSLAFLVATSMGTTIINRTAKMIMHRVRPQLWESLSPEYDFAFPSGHAMTSMTLVASLVILTWGTIWCLTILIFGSLFVIGIGWTRLYLGVHFPSDILAGWMVSVAWAIGVSLVIRPQFRKAIAPTEEEPVSETSLLPQEKEAVSKD